MAVAGSMTSAYKLTLVDGQVKVSDKTTLPWSLCESLLEACNKLSAEPPQPAMVAGPDVEMVRIRMAARIQQKEKQQ